MGTSRTARRGAATLAALALLTGCVPTLADDGGDGDATRVGAGQLDEEQLSGVLPRVEQQPPGFSVDPDSGNGADQSDPEATAYPASCLDLRLAGAAGTDLKTHEQAAVKREFVGDNGGFLSVTVTSHDTAVPDELFDDAGAAQGACGTFQLIDSQGPTSWKLSPVTFPQMGDRSYSTRVESTTEGDIFEGGVIHLAASSVGNNLVYVVYSSGPASEYDPTAVESFTRATVDNLTAL